MRINNDFFKGLADWNKITGQDGTPSYIIYEGNGRLERKKSHIIPLDPVTPMLQEIYAR